jgi:hypothetical protein
LHLQTDVSAYSGTLKKIGVSEAMLPLGRISKEKLLEAKKILLQLQ